MKSGPAKSCDVHLWKHCLLGPAPEISMEWFSVEEKWEIGKIAAYERRIQFIRAHAFLKKVLELYTHQPPDQIRLARGLNGKPRIHCDHPHPPFFFNLSYRHDYALLAISGEPCVGVDVEEVEEIGDFFPFLFDHFSEDERRRILAEESQQQQLSLLYTLWTMKEAVVKSLAIGLPRKMSKYDLSSFLNEPEGYGAFDPSHSWRIEAIPIASEYKAAVALRARDVAFEIFEYPEK